MTTTWRLSFSVFVNGPGMSTAIRKDPRGIILVFVVG